MKLDVSRLDHLRRLHRNRKAAYEAAFADRQEQRDLLRGLELDRQRLAQGYNPGAHADAFVDLDRRIAAAKTELEAMQEREVELAEVSATAGQTFRRALEHAQAEGLDLPK